METVKAEGKMLVSL